MNSYSFDLEQITRGIRRAEEFDDDLGREKVAQEIANEIAHEPSARVIGVYGSWGSGKSYLLGQVIKCIERVNTRVPDGQESPKHMIVCGFSPWRYEMEGDLGAGLVKAILDSAHRFLKDYPIPEPASFEQAGRCLLELIGEVGPAIVPGGEALAKLVGIVGKAGIERRSSTAPPAVDEIQQQMRKLVAAILDAANRAYSPREHRLVVFIDDLDRCTPENMVRMFEWLKVHLLTPGCVYVMALDNVAASRAIVGRYKEYLGRHSDFTYGFRYLEKLVDSEYELGLAPNAEKMALARAFENEDFRRLSQAAQQLSGTDFPGVGSIDRLLELRCLSTPRTMLKIVDKFKRAMEALLTEEARQFRSGLPSGYQFWVIFITAMYYQLEPDVVGEFIRGRGIIYQLLSSPRSVDTTEWGEDAKREFCKYASDLGESAGSSLQVPRPDILARLAVVVQQNCFTGE